jgi:hypothetical protein
MSYCVLAERPVYVYDVELVGMAGRSAYAAAPVLICGISVWMFAPPVIATLIDVLATVVMDIAGATTAGGAARSCSISARVRVSVAFVTTKTISVPEFETYAVGAVTALVVTPSALTFSISVDATS